MGIAEAGSTSTGSNVNREALPSLIPLRLPLSPIPPTIQLFDIDPRGTVPLPALTRSYEPSESEWSSCGLRHVARKYSSPSRSRSSSAKWSCDPVPATLAKSFRYASRNRDSSSGPGANLGAPTRQPGARPDSYAVNRGANRFANRSGPSLASSLAIITRLVLLAVLFYLISRFRRRLFPQSSWELLPRPSLRPRTIKLLASP
jgi:hypothetical protein